MNSPLVLDEFEGEGHDQFVEALQQFLEYPTYENFMVMDGIMHDHKKVVPCELMVDIYSNQFLQHADCAECPLGQRDIYEMAPWGINSGCNFLGMAIPISEKRFEAVKGMLLLKYTNFFNFINLIISGEKNGETD